jgi:hypothetical protein
MRFLGLKIDGMKKFAGLVLGCAMLAGAASAADNELTPQEKAAGWALLFDGKTFRGWRDLARKTPPGNAFTIENGCLKVNPRPAIAEDLFTTENFSDFELLFDWKVAPGGNSGVKYRIQDHVFINGQRAKKFEDNVNAFLKGPAAARALNGTDYVIGFEYQILDDATNPDARNGTTHRTGALYDAFPPMASPARPVGRFNNARIIVQGEHVQHWLNGVRVLDVHLDAPEVAQGAARRWGVGTPVYDLIVRHAKEDCPISLQNHNTEAWFKNIKVRRLPRAGR